MILISGWVGRVPPRRVAVSGCVFATLANIGLYCFDPFALQLSFGVLAGVGYGLVFAATVAGAAAAAEPDRIYAIGNGGALLLIVALMAVLPLAGARLGPLGIFAALGALALLSAPWFAGLRLSSASQELQLAAWRVSGAPGLLFAWGTFSTGAHSTFFPSGSAEAFTCNRNGSPPFSRRACSSVCSVRPPPHCWVGERIAG
jgi:hypothetical protein